MNTEIYYQIRQYRECSDSDTADGNYWDGKRWCVFCGGIDPEKLDQAGKLITEMTAKDGIPRRVVCVTEEVIFETENVSEK